MRLRPGLLALLITPFGFGCEAPTVPGHGAAEIYEFRLQTTPLSVLRWPAGTTISVYVAGGAGPRAAVLENAFVRGAAVWNARALYGEYRLERVTSLMDADVVLLWSDETAPVETSHCPPQVSRAVTTFCLTAPQPSQARLQPFPLLPPHHEVASRVRMLVTVLGSEAQQADRVERLVAHELGHVLGIAQHSLDARDLMYGGDVPRLEPSRRDAATVHVLYHTRADIHP
jgi:hypothetical protein